MFIERYGRVFPSQRDSHLYVTPVTTLEYVKEHPEIVDGVRLGDRIYHSGIQGGIGSWSIITSLFLRLDPKQAEQFAEHLTTGAGLHRGHPLLMLRNRLVGSQRDQYSTLSGREALVAITIKAWNAWREGKTLQTLSCGFCDISVGSGQIKGVLAWRLSRPEIAGWTCVKISTAQT